jgi:pilus assembly protein CpaB
MKAANPSGNVVRRIRVRAVLFLFLALVAGAGAVLLVKNYLDQAGRARAGAVSTTPVVVAALPIPIGTALEKQHLVAMNWPVESVPEGSFRSPEEVVGKTVRQALVKGEAVLADRLADESVGRGLTALLAKGTRAMAVKVDQVVGVAGFVQPGDYVDVISTMTPDDETRKDLKNNPAKIAKIILQNIKVLAVGEHMTTQGSKPVKVQVVTLEVTVDQSERLALASRHGELLLTMRSRVDQDQVATAGITPLDLLSPDEGAELKAKEKEKGDEKSTQEWLAMRRRQQRREREARAARQQKEKKPDAPVVEVLRGDRIEERKLRPTPDSK